MFFVLFVVENLRSVPGGVRVRLAGEPIHPRGSPQRQASHARQDAGATMGPFGSGSAILAGAVLLAGRMARFGNAGPTSSTRPAGLRVFRG